MRAGLLPVLLKAAILRPEPLDLGLLVMVTVLPWAGYVVRRSSGSRD